MNTRKFLIGIGAATALLSAAQAGNPLNNISNGDATKNTEVVFSNLNAWGWKIGGDLRANSTAIGNSFTASTEGSTYMYNKQWQIADVGATVNLDFGKVKGDVDVVAVGVCNNASLKTDGGYASVNNDQRCATWDPFAVADVKLGYVGGDTSIAATAISNNMAIDVNNGGVYLRTDHQTNMAATYASVNAEIGATAGNVALSATAVGNNLSINQGFGRP